MVAYRKLANRLWGERFVDTPAHGDGSFSDILLKNWYTEVLAANIKNVASEQWYCGMSYDGSEQLKTHAEMIADLDKKKRENAAPDAQPWRDRERDRGGRGGGHR